MTTQQKITIEDILKWAKPHQNKMEGAKQVVLNTKNFKVSIVGGCQGLYGDFNEDFEVAIIDNTTDDFMTKFFFPDASDDVLPYQKRNEVEELVKMVVGNKEFQVL